MMSFKRALQWVGAVLLAGVLSFLVYQYFVLNKQYKALALRYTPLPIKQASGNGFDGAGVSARNSWLDVQKQVKDTVVQVFAHVADFNWLEPYKTPDQGEGTGSGFFIDEQGNLITNYHVVAQASSVQVQIPAFGMERFDVEIQGVSPERDIALLRLTPEAHEKITKKLKKIPYLILGDSDLILRSQEVLALGFPMGQMRLKSTLGIVSGRERLGYFGYIQITAPLNPGNSGGPALNTRGEVIGINSRGITEAQNVGYIIPINEVKSALKDLHSVKLLRRPVLGCIFDIATPEMTAYLGNPGEGGWYIAKVFPNTLMARIGVKEGDMLYEINGHRVDVFGEMSVPWSEDKVSLFELLNRYTVGDTLTFQIYRRGEMLSFTFKLEQRFITPVRAVYPEFEREATDYEVLGGMVVMNLSMNHLSIMLSRVPDLVRYAKHEAQFEPVLVITHVMLGSPAHMSKVLRAGELITEVNDIPVKTLQDFRQAVVKSCDTGFLTIKTDDNRCGVLLVEKILKLEPILAGRYFFPISPLLKVLQKQEKHEKPEEKT